MYVIYTLFEKVMKWDISERNVVDVFNVLNDGVTLSTFLCYAQNPCNIPHYQVSQEWVITLSLYLGYWGLICIQTHIQIFGINFAVS